MVVSFYTHVHRGMYTILGKPAVHLPGWQRTLGTAFIGCIVVRGMHAIRRKTNYTLCCLREQAFAFSRIVVFMHCKT